MPKPVLSAMLSCSGLELTDAEKRIFAEFNPLGVTLFGRNIFEIFDDFSGRILLPLGGMLISIFAGWVLDRRLYHNEISNQGTVKTPYFRMLVFSLRYIAPLAIGLVFLDQLGAFSFLK